MSKCILVTGITGFVGGHLAEALLEETGVEVSGASRGGRWPSELAHLTGRAALYPCDLGDPAGVEALLRRTEPEVIYHLAGYPHAGRSSREVGAAWAGNLTATVNLYEGLLRWGGRPRVVAVGSGLVYGDAEESDRAFDEDCPLRPTTPYASSKAAADLAGYQYARATGLAIVRVRPFNHIGPRQSPEFAIPHFAQQIAAAERGRRPPFLETGNLSPRRDLTDVRDVVRAYRLLAEHGKAGEAYNVGSGRVISMQDVLNHLLELARVRMEVRQRADLVRAAETSVFRADVARIRRETGWEPAISLQQTLSDTLEYWRGQS